MVDYNPNIPQPTDNLSTSQGQILNNFGQLETIFDINHWTWADAATAKRGMHRKVDFPDPTTVSAPTGNDSVLYPKTVSAVTGLFFDNAVGSSTVWRGGSTDGNITYTSNKLSLPNGLQVSYGSATTGGAGTAAITFSFPTNVYSATLTARSNGTPSGGAAGVRCAFWSTAPTNTGGTAVVTNPAGTAIVSCTVFWIAIGD